MPTLAIRQTTVAAMTAKQRNATRWALESVGLINPASYTAPGGNIWLVFDDHRITLRDVAYLGRLANKIASLPAGYTPPTDLSNTTAAEVRAWIRNYLDGQVVWPVTIPANADPWQTVLAAQSAPATVQAAASVPSTWTAN